MQEKDAGGELIGGLAGLLTRPFVGAARSGDVRQRIVDTLTRRVNNPLERGLHRVGVGKLIEGGANAAAYLGGAPEAIRTPWAREQAANVVRTMAAHPDAAAFSGITTFTAPIPGITEAYLGTKGLATKALERLTPTPAAPVARAPLLPLPAEPTFLKLPPKLGSFAIKDASWKKHLAEFLVPGAVRAFWGDRAADAFFTPNVRFPTGAAAVNSRPAPRVPGLSPLQAEPTFLKLPPKVAAAYVEGRKAALEKFAVLLV